jgi:ribonuclease J
MKIIIHRGSNQIGGTCIEFRSVEARLIFDIGEELPDVFNPLKKKSDLDVDDLFVKSKETNNKIDGVFISHNHGDHIGMLKNVKKGIPIYIGEISAQVYNTICKFISDKNEITTKTFLENQKTIQIKDFKITPFLVDHSAYDSYAFLIENNQKKVIYTGDFRQHGSRGELTRQLSSNINAHKPDILLIEGTNLYKNEFIAETEDELSNRAVDFIRKISGNIFVLQSTTNIDRIKEIYKASIKTNRILVIDIFSAHILANIPDDDLKYLKIFYPYWLRERMFKTGNKDLMFEYSNRKISNEELKNRQDLIILIRENMLFDVEKRMNYIDGGLIYSKWEGYKETDKTKSFIDFFNKNNLKTESIHTSGHADVLTIKEFVNNIAPKNIIPVHTETPEKYKELFGNKTILLNDKDIFEL